MLLSFPSLLGLFRFRCLFMLLLYLSFFARTSLSFDTISVPLPLCPSVPLSFDTHFSVSVSLSLLLSPQTPKKACISLCLFLSSGFAFLLILLKKVLAGGLLFPLLCEVPSLSVLFTVCSLPLLLEGEGATREGGALFPDTDTDREAEADRDEEREEEEEELETEEGEGWPEEGVIVRGGGESVAC